MVLGIRRIARLKRFDKAYKRLSERNKAAVDEALAELLSRDRLPSGRNLKKLGSRRNTWAIRIDRGIRLTFEVADGVCCLRNVGEHDKTLDNS